MSGFPTGVAFEDALALLVEAARRHATPAIRLATARAHGRVLAADVVAPIDLPPFDNSAMDGYALRHADLSAAGEGRLRMVGEQFAGPALGLELEAGDCVRIMTGAPMPAGADTVALQENVVHEGDHVRVPRDTPAGANVRRAGEDVRAGTCVLERGSVLTPARVAIAASLGIAQLETAERPTVAVFTTGDELVEPGLPLRPGEIYNSNRELLLGLLRADGLEPTAWPTLPDEPARMRAMLRDAAASFDLVLTCGGVSAGAKDHVPALLQAHGEVLFWKVRMKPGMPVLAGRLDRAAFLGLPGNPVSVLATWLTLGRALIDGMQGRVEPGSLLRAQLLTPLDKPHARREFVRGRLQPGDDGVLRVAPHPATGSHRLLAAAQSDALVVVPEGACRLPAGAVVDVLPY